MRIEDALKAARHGASVQRPDWGDDWFTFDVDGSPRWLPLFSSMLNFTEDDVAANDWRIQEALTTDRAPTPRERDMALDFANRVGTWRGSRLSLAQQIAQLLADDRLHYATGLKVEP